MAFRRRFVADCGIAALATRGWSQQPPSFDVSVVKPADPANTRFGMGFGPDGRTLTVDGLTVIQIIREAYGVLPDELSVRPSAATGGWIDSERFDISAKSEGHGPVDKAQSNLMLRQLLADRFGLQFHRETSLARSLSRSLGRPVNDETGLRGQYDFNLSSAPDEIAADTSGPSLFTAVQDQLGLKLESRKAPVETIVIDRIGTPSPN